MKIFLVVLPLFLASQVLADTEKNIKVNRIEMTEVVTDDVDAQKDNAPATKATDYNSSRSNRGDSVRLDDVVEDDDASDGTRATDYNSSRSNKADSAQADNADESADTKATDYNSSRSNKSFSAATINDCDKTDKDEAECATP